MMASDIILPSELKHALQEDLHQSGIIDDITSSLRQHIIQKFNAVNQVVRKQHHGVKEVGVLSIILEHLEMESMHKTASVFVAEACISGKILTISDAKGVLGFDDSICWTNGCSALSCILDGKTNLHHPLASSTFTQTSPGRSKSDGTSPSETACAQPYLEGNIFLTFSKDVEARLRKEMNAEMVRFKENTILNVRLEAAAKERRANEEIRSRLEEDYRKRMTQMNEKERRFQDELRIQQKEAEASNYKIRQDLLKQLEKSQKDGEDRRIQILQESEDLELKEGRLERMLDIANDRMKQAEEKEQAVREMQQEANQKATNSAKNAYEDATAANALQGDLLEKELAALNEQRRVVVGRQRDLLDSREEAKCLLAEREELRSEIEARKNQLVKDHSDFKVMLLEKETDLTDLREELRRKGRNEVDFRLDCERQLQVSREECRIARSLAAAATREKEEAVDELSELRKLLRRSQNALENISPNFVQESMSRHLEKSRLRYCSKESKTKLEIVEAGHPDGSAPHYPSNSNQSTIKKVEPIRVTKMVSDGAGKTILLVKSPKVQPQGTPTFPSSVSPKLTQTEEKDPEAPIDAQEAPMKPAQLSLAPEFTDSSSAGYSSEIFQDESETDYSDDYDEPRKTSTYDEANSTKSISGDVIGAGIVDEAWQKLRI